jgi:hypothetical protein
MAGNGQKTFRDRVLRLCEQAGQEGAIRRCTFAACVIQGPAVIYPNRCQFYSPTFRSPEGLDSILWDIPVEKTTIVGAILVEDCIFRDCTFENVGVAAPAEMAAAIRAQAAEA